MATKTEIESIRKQAFKEAAAYLERTAEDFLEMATRVKIPPLRDAPGFRAKLQEKTVLADKASLLHGQSLHIGEMV